MDNTLAELTPFNTPGTAIFQFGDSANVVNTLLGRDPFNKLKNTRAHTPTKTFFPQNDRENLQNKPTLTILPIMLTYIPHAIETLRQNGFRITTPRQQVLQVLNDATRPISPYDGVDLMAQKSQKTDAITIYRIFDCLEKNGLIHRILSSGKFVKCSIEAHTPHSQNHCCHYIAICDGCGTTREIHCHDPIPIPAIPDMIITGHRLEFTGRCTLCQQEPSS